MVKEIGVGHLVRGLGEDVRPDLRKRALKGLITLVQSDPAVVDAILKDEGQDGVPDENNVGAHLASIMEFPHRSDRGQVVAHQGVLGGILSRIPFPRLNPSRLNSPFSEEHTPVTGSRVALVGATLKQSGVAMGAGEVTAVADPGGEVSAEKKSKARAEGRDWWK
ncbi:unnamed protein product, partial [Choristocarpus tenellus]